LAATSFARYSKVILINSLLPIY